MARCEKKVATLRAWVGVLLPSFLAIGVSYEVLPLASAGAEAVRVALAFTVGLALIAASVGLLAEQVD
jgi:hypothetical protein